MKTATASARIRRTRLGLKGGGIGSLALGAINGLVGLLLLSSPIAAALAVPAVFGVLLLIQGAGLIILAFSVRA